jgi:prepilin-type N-terminal cleavage/methylation domain-containing protein
MTPAPRNAEPAHRHFPRHRHCHRCEHHRELHREHHRERERGCGCKHEGFTIIEVLVALAIFGFFAVVLVASYLNVLNAYQAVAENPRRDLDVRFARNALLAEADFETAQKGDQFDGASGRHVTWSAVIEPTLTANLFQVTFTCQLDAGPNPEDKEETVVEIFRILRPTWANTSGFSPDAATLRSEARDRITQARQPSPLSGIGPSSSIGGASSSGGNSPGGNSPGAFSGGAKGGGGKNTNTPGGGGAPKR